MSKRTSAPPSTPPLPGGLALLEERALAHLQGAGRRGLSAEELWDRLGAEALPWAFGVEEVERALAGLAAEGLAVEVEGRWVPVEATPWEAGTVELVDGGNAVVRSDSEPAWFVRRRHLRGALDGDTVLLRPLSRRRPMGGGRLPEAAVVRVLARRRPTLVGNTEADDEGRRWLVPYDPRLDLDLEVEGAERLPEESFVVVAVEARSRVVEVLGDPVVPGVDVKVVLRHYGIPEDFPPEALAEAVPLPPDPDPKDWAGREDLRAARVITIDGESARDFDDAVAVEPLPDGGFRFAVHIADVSHYVREGSALDLAAYERGTSVYYPERAVPMLPEALSNGLCSLKPRVPRLALSAFLEVGPDGRVRSRRFAETVIESQRRMTYDEVRRLLEDPRPGDHEEYGEILPMLADLRRLMEILLAVREARGSIDFDLPEGDVELDTDGVVVGVVPGERHVAHRIVEELMIAANEAVAETLVGADAAALFRVHDPPSPERLAELREILAGLGIRLAGDLSDLAPAALQEVLRKVAGRPEEHFVTTLVLRSMQRAFYDPECRGHYALASRYYTHFTSPIRRYPDLVVHRRLKDLLAGRAADEAARTRIPERLPEMAEHASSTERRAEQSERDLLQWKKVRFLAGRVGERFPGRVTGVQPFGLFVQLDGYYVDGLVPIRTFGDDYYRCEPEAHRLVGERHGRVFQLGDPVEVDLVGVDLRHRGLDFKLAGMPEPAARREDGRRDRDARERRERGARERRRAERGGA
jgi:ribonuclease R